MYVMTFGVDKKGIFCYSAVFQKLNCPKRNFQAVDAVLVWDNLMKIKWSMAIVHVG